MPTTALRDTGDTLWAISRLSASVEKVACKVSSQILTKVAPLYHLIGEVKEEYDNGGAGDESRAIRVIHESDLDLTTTNIEDAGIAINAHGKFL